MSRSPQLSPKQRGSTDEHRHRRTPTVIPPRSTPGRPAGRRSSGRRAPRKIPGTPQPTNRTRPPRLAGRMPPHAGRCRQMLRDAAPRHGPNASARRPRLASRRPDRATDRRWTISSRTPLPNMLPGIPRLDGIGSVPDRRSGPRRLPPRRLRNPLTTDPRPLALNARHFPTTQPNPRFDARPHPGDGPGPVPRRASKAQQDPGKGRKCRKRRPARPCLPGLAAVSQSGRDSGPG
jgi:hypothetical protein